jgi:hypothetical protein
MTYPDYWEKSRTFAHQTHIDHVDKTELVAIGHEWRVERNAGY